MNRLTKAWKALRGTLEPEVREVEREVVKVVEQPILGSPEPVTIYAAEVPTGEKQTTTYRDSIVVLRHETRTLYYLTCEQAHAEHPGCKVEAKQIWRIGRTYLTNVNVFPIEVQPKPKRPKGRA